MALLYPAVAAAGVWALGSYTWNLKKGAQAAQNAEVDAQYQSPYPQQGQWMPIDQMFLANTRGRFRSVQESVDVQGAKIFLVDYGTGARTISYVDPRVVL